MFPLRAFISNQNRTATAVKYMTGGAFLLFITTVTVVKFLLSANLPNRWSVTQLFCTYQDGCLKRALFGALLWIFRYWNGSDLYSLAVKLSWISSLGVLIVLLASISVNILRLLAKGRAAAPLWVISAAMFLIALSIMASPSIQFFFHMAGYLDAFSILTLVAGWISVDFCLRNRHLRKTLVVFLVAVPAVVSMAIHELSAVAFLPTYFALSFLRLKEQGVIRRKSIKFLCILSILLSVVAALMAVVCTTIVQFLWGGLTPSAALWRINHSSLSEIFDISIDYFDSSSFFVSIKGSVMGLLSIRNLCEISLSATHSAATAIMIMIPIVLFGNGASSVRPIVSDKCCLGGQLQKELCWKWFLLCCSTPLAMSFLGWDYYRWGSLLTITFLCSMASPEGFKIVTQSVFLNMRASRGAWRLAVIALCFSSLFIPPLLFDGKKPFAINDFSNLESINSQLVQFNDALECQSYPTQYCIKVLSE